VLEAIRAAEIEAIVLKGPAVAHTVYPDPMLRTFGDLDLLVRERDWHAIHAALLDLGFIQLDNLPQPPPKLFPNAVTYELKYLHPGVKFVVEVHFDDLYNAGLATRDIDGVRRRAVLIELDGVPVKVLSIEDQLVHLSAHAHFHGYTRLNWLADLAVIVRDHQARVDWNRVIDIVRSDEVEVPVYFSLTVLRQMMDIRIPQFVFDATRPDRFRRWWHEHYLPVDEVVSLQPMSRPDFSFYFSPLFKRLLPDLLVMGRRREKLGYLPRVAVPPADWLRYYYHLGETDRLAIHYILHPVKLAYHYVNEILSALPSFKSC